MKMVGALNAKMMDKMRKDLLKINDDLLLWDVNEDE
jgi:hypothetical protein